MGPSLSANPVSVRQWWGGRTDVHAESSNAGSANVLARSGSLICARHSPARSRFLSTTPQRMLRSMSRPSSLGDLRASGWESRPVKEELRTNAVVALSKGEPLVDGVVGYEDTVLPQLANAL